MLVLLGEWGGHTGSGGGRLLKEQGNFDFDNHERCKSPRRAAQGRISRQHTGGGNRSVISQTTGRTQAPGPAATPLGSPAPPRYLTAW